MHACKTLVLPGQKRSLSTLALLPSLMLTQKVDFTKKFPDADPLAIDLMEKMLTFDPRKRITVEQALKHPWLAALHDEAAEPAAPGTFIYLFIVSFDPRKRITVEQALKHPWLAVLQDEAAEPAAPGTFFYLLLLYA